MGNHPQIDEIRTLVDNFLQAEPEYFCVNVRIKPTNNIKIYIDGDNGISIDECVLFNRKIYKLIEDKNWFHDGDFSLEISSPGVDEPLVNNRQYTKNKDRFIDVLLLTGEKKGGRLINVAQENITIEYIRGKGKQAQQVQEIISYSNIKTTTVQIKF